MSTNFLKDWVSVVPASDVWLQGRYISTAYSFSFLFFRKQDEAEDEMKKKKKKPHAGLELKDFVTLVAAGLTEDVNVDQRLVWM